ncbi:MAG TPA: hypothetical protein VK431_04900, partial [Nitrosopumilaceae archaeon]|nr:hypothetical protein [Nitrosopumilaceae archaeon]
MTHKKGLLPVISPILIGLIALSPIRAFEPHQIKNATIHAQKRAKFAKVMAGALVKHCWQQSLSLTTIESK